MKTRLALLLLCIMLVMHLSVIAQVKIGDNATTINTASLLELETTNKGFVLPRVSLTNISSSAPLAAGLLTGTVVYNTNSGTTGGSGVGIYYWDGSKWNFIANTATTSNYWALAGNSGTSASSNYIGTSDAVDFVARTNNTERLRITSGGNVGIGLTNPSYKLAVLAASNPLYLSGVQATATFSSDSVLTINAGVVKKAPYSSLTGNFWALTGNSGTSASSNYIGTSDAVDFVARTNNTERLRITSGGNVGIGLTNPSYKLAVLAASNPLYLSGVQATATFNSDSVLTINAGVVKKAPYSSLTGNFWTLLGNSGTSASTNFIGTSDAVDFVTRTNNTERFRVTSAGNVGIGLTNPSYKLSVLAASNPLYLSGVQATSTFTSDSVLTINSGVVKKAPYSALTGNFWSLTGNAGTSYSTNFIGTTDNVSLRFRTNNTEQMVLDSLGNLSIGSYGPSTFNVDNTPKLSVDYGTTTSNTIAYFRGSIDNYFQINLRNKSNGSNASTDYVATSDDGTDSTYYVDMGINGSNYAAGLDNWGGPHDAYLYTYGRNLLIGTQAYNTDIVFLGGGGRTKYNAMLRMDASTGNVIVGKGDNYSNATGNTIRGPNASGTNIAGGSLTLQGGSGTGTAAGGSLYLNGGTTGTGTAGNIVMSTASLERVRIDQSGNVGIGISSPSYRLSVLSSSNPLYLSGVQSTSTFSSDSILTINAGVVKKTPYSSLAGGGNWSITGNAGTTAGTNFLGTTDAKDLVFKTNNNEVFRATTGGNIGIGTTTPSYTISLDGDGNHTFGMEKNTTGSNVGQDLTIKAGGVKIGQANKTGGDLYLSSGMSTGTGTSDIYLQTATSGTAGSTDNATTTKMMISSSGNVGIGILSPSYKLSVLAASNPLYLSGVQATSTFSSDSLLTINAGVVKKTPYSSLTGSFWSLTGNSGTTTGTNFLGTTDAKDLVFKTNNAEVFRATTGGNIGIGTTTPSYSISLDGDGDHIIGMEKNTTGSNVGQDLTIKAGGVKIGQANKTGGDLYLSSGMPTGTGTSNIYFQTAGNGSSGSADVNPSTNMTILGNGNVGIGVTSPANKLQVVGTNPLSLLGVQNGTGTDSLLVIRNGVVMKVGSLTGFFIIKGQYDVVIPSYISNNSGLTVTVAVPSAPYSAAGPNPVVLVNPEINLPDGLIIAWARVSATNTVSINFRNVTNQSVPPQTIKFDISIQQ